MNTNQLFIWRRLYRDGMLAPAGASAPALLPVTITNEPVSEKASAPPDAGWIEIELPGRYRVRVDAAVDGEALGRVLDVLGRRPVGRSLGEGR